MKLRMMLLSAAGLLFSLSSLAATCKNANGGISMVNYDLTTTLTTDQNIKGNGTELNRTQDIHVNATCPQATGRSAPIVPISHLSPWSKRKASGNIYSLIRIILSVR